MLKKIKGADISKIVRIVFLLIVAFRMCCHLFYTTEKEFQIFRDQEIYKAMIYLCLICIVYRGIKIKDYIAWITALVGFVAMYVVFKVWVINPDTYGPDYFKVLVCKGILYVLFIGLLLDLLRHRPYSIKAYIKNPAVICYILFVLVFFITNRDAFIPYCCPAIALLLTRFDDEKRKELTYILSGSAYMSFVFVFTKSLIQNPNRYLGGRYYGSFLQIGSAGASCAVALCGCLYMFLVFKEKKNRAGMVLALIFAVYPIIAILMMESRSVELGILCVLAGVFCFLHNRGIKTTFIRIGIIFLLIALVPIILIVLSKIVLVLCDAGKIDPENLNYFWNHILYMASVGSMEDSIFTPGSIMFSLDAFSSTRLSIYFEKIRHIKLTGFNEYSRIGYNAHNFFFANLVRYGLLGGIPFIGWFASCIFICAKNLTKKTYLIYPLFIFLLMLGCYSTLSLYITCFGGCIMLITQVLCININEPTVDASINK